MQISTKMLFFKKLTKYLFQLKVSVLKVEYGMWCAYNNISSTRFSWRSFDDESSLQSNRNHCSSASITFQTKVTTLPLSFEQCHNYLIAFSLHTSTEVPQGGSENDMNTDKGLTPVRLKFLSILFDYPLEEIPGIMAKYKFLNHLSLSLIQEKVTILQNFNMSQSFMKNNLRIMYHTSSWELQKRLQLLKDHGFLEKNPVLSSNKLGHYLECPNEVFHLGFQKLCSEYESLEGCSNQVEYIQKRLCCSKETASSLVSSYPLNRGVSNTKVKDFLDFVLTEAGLSPDTIVNNMRLCSFSVTRLRERLKIMQSANICKEQWLVFWSLSENKFKARFVNS